MRNDPNLKTVITRITLVDNASFEELKNVSIGLTLATTNIGLWSVLLHLVSP
jgi:hypothetical protein